MVLRQRSVLSRYVLAVVMPVIISLAIQLTWPFFESAPTSPFIAGVMFCAWYGGFGPGIFATALSFLVADYFFTVPYFAFWAPNRGDTVRLTTLLTVGAVISILSEKMHESQLKTENALATARLGQNRYRSLVKTTADLVWSTRINHQVESNPEALSQLTGISADDLQALAGLILYIRMIVKRFDKPITKRKLTTNLMNCKAGFGNVTVAMVITTSAVFPLSMTMESRFASG
jgi:K+-sensing histidine kinase KdpD